MPDMYGTLRDIEKRRLQTFYSLQKNGKKKPKNADSTNGSVNPTENLPKGNPATSVIKLSSKSRDRDTDEKERNEGE